MKRAGAHDYAKDSEQAEQKQEQRGGEWHRIGEPSFITFHIHRQSPRAVIRSFRFKRAT
jgi:hypothetical protein